MVDYPPLGFRALVPDLPIRFYRRNLPHWRQYGATYFVTFRLADSLPQSKLIQLAEERDFWVQAHPDPSENDWEQHQHELMTKVEKWLDQGHGDCILQKESAAVFVESAMRYFDKKRYSLFSFVIMPNHCHIILKPLDGYKLEDILQSWKSYTSLKINRMCGRTGVMWQEEAFDRIIRDSDHLRRVVRYIEKNPIKANITCPCWTTPEWNMWMGR